ncbi:hypothetical protein [Klebsiella pneumoniae]|uniref:hypothetical protein n=1 Tax=Klebsiella pneumoniae TaxID=573 RepID=UPI001D1874C4|nr:hypothetical protein [Klebsiella pneumoniae]
MALPSVAAIEVNISRPNLEADGMALPCLQTQPLDVISIIRRKSDFSALNKTFALNAGNVADIALAAEAAGADGGDGERCSYGN